MKKSSVKFSNSTVDYYLPNGKAVLGQVTDRKNTVLLTDENVFKAHEKRFRNWNTIVLKPGEQYKVQETVDTVIGQLIDMEADRKTTLVGIGGGVITDITGYTASVYMRGIPFGFMPTTLLSMVDAAIGGKNGVDRGDYKNIVGIIRQPGFILYDASFLSTLPLTEWENGFAEIIKHSCIKDAAMFRELEKNSIEKYRDNKKLLLPLIRRNALIKTKVVQQDEFEKGDRKLLNFGHTLGHALETQYELSHGQAIAIGMTYACHISAAITGFRYTDRVVSLLQQYGLPTYAGFDAAQVFSVLKMDKKRERKEMNYVLLEKIGKGIIQSIPLKELEKMITSLGKHTVPYNLAGRK